MTVKNTILSNDARDAPRQEDDPRRCKWRLTQDAFDQFLSLLDLDRDRAGEIYETLRRNLVQLFIWRGCRDPEAHADETINRIIRKIDEGEEIRDLISYAHGVARRLLLEIFKKQEREQIGIEELPTLAAPPEQQDEGARTGAKALSAARWPRNRAASRLPARASFTPCLIK